MKNETTALKIDCVNIVNMLNSQDVISDASKLHKYISIGDTAVKIECIYMLIEKEKRSASLIDLIIEMEEVYAFVITT